MFKKYMHIERFGNVEVEGIELGESYIFPKLDGTNASVWYDTSYDFDKIRGGSRNRDLSFDNDNQGFLSYVYQGDQYYKYDMFFRKHPFLRLFGEWLVPHTLKTYREDVWKKFWIFDVFNDETNEYVHYDVYKPWLEEFGLDYIPPLAKIKNGNYENFIHVLNNNNLFIKDGEGNGEGIVIKNYAYYNKFGRQTWAKIITTEFKEKHYKEMGCPEADGKMLEEEITEEFVTTALVDKEYAKIVNEHLGWTSKYIPQLLHTVFYCVIKEEMWEILKKHNFPTINFKTLKHMIFAKVKRVKPELF